jgi:hypothetical protein
MHSVLARNQRRLTGGPYMGSSAFSGTNLESSPTSSAGTPETKYSHQKRGAEPSMLQLLAGARAPSGGSDDRSWGRRHFLLSEDAAADTGVRSETRRDGVAGVESIGRWTTGAGGGIIGAGGDVILFSFVYRLVLFRQLRCSIVLPLPRNISRPINA